MIALSIRQPWAWLIVNGFKDVENRSWPTNYRGRFLVHAGKTLSVADYDAALLFVEGIYPNLVSRIPAMESLPLGGVVGLARLVDCVREHPSRWFTGGVSQGDGFGFVLDVAHAEPLPFMPWKGRQGFFDVLAKPLLDKP